MLHTDSAQIPVPSTAPSIIPVIHYQNDAQAVRNAEIAYEAGCKSVFLIHMNCQNDLLWDAAAKIKQRWPERLIGINHLGVAPDVAVAANIAAGIDLTWTDEQLTHSAASDDRAEAAKAALRDTDHQLFIGVEFKHQPQEPDPPKAARKAIEFGFIPTTSGTATGVAAQIEPVAALRNAIGPDAPLAIASGITPENIAMFAPQLTHILVATGISSSFYEFDADKISKLMKAVNF